MIKIDEREFEKLVAENEKLRFELEQMNNGFAYPQGKTVGQVSRTMGGVTIRQYYAAKAMQGIVMTAINMPDDVVARHAFSLADRMIEEESNG